MTSHQRDCSKPGPTRRPCPFIRSLATLLLLAFLATIEPALILAQSPAGNRPELVLQVGHAGGVSRVAFSPDGRWLAAGNWVDGTVKLWEIETGRELRALRGHRSRVEAVVFSPDGRFLASASSDKTVKLWDVSTGQQLRTFTGHKGWVTAVAFSPDGRLLASGSHDMTIKLWDAGTGRELRALAGHSEWVNTVAFSPDGRWLASGSSSGRQGGDSTVRIWDVATGRERRVLSGHTASVNAVDFSPDGQTVASASSDTTIRIWDLATGKELRTLAGHGAEVNSLAFFTPGGRQLASASGGKRGRDTTVRVWDLATGRELRRLVGHTAFVYSVAVSAGGQTLASASFDGVIKLWDGATGRELRALASGNVSLVHALAFSPDGGWLVTGDSDGASLWDLSGRREVRRLGSERVLGVAFSPDGQWLASASFNGTIRLLDIPNAQERRAFPGHTGKVLPYGTKFSPVAFSPNGRALASGYSNSVKLWDLATGRELGTLVGHTGLVQALSFSPDGRRLASAGLDKTVKLWEVSTGRELHTMAHQAPEVHAVAFSPDGRWLASAGNDGTVRLWDAATGREWRTLSAHRGTVHAVTFSPDGRRLASGGLDQTLRLWEVATGRELGNLAGHTARIYSVAFSPDGRLLATGGHDGSTRLWDVAAGSQLALLATMRKSGDWVVVTPDGLFDGSEQGTEKLVAWRIRNRTYPLNRFFADYFTPGLLARLLAGERPRPTLELAALKLPPDVRVTSPTAGSVFKQERVAVTVEATEQGGGVAEVRLYHNGKLVGTRPGAPGATSAYAFAIDLIPGENLIQASALSQDRIESKDDGARVTYEAPQVARPALHVLAVGINAYEDPSFNLGFARPDAEALARFFEQRGGQLFGPVNVIKLLDKSATKGNILQQLDHLTQRARPEDVLIIYLAGHGVGLGQQYYFLPHEMRKESDEDAAVQRYGLSAARLSEALHRASALKQVLILDACHSETALDILAKVARSRGLGTAEEKAFKMLARAYGIHLIAASTKQQYALEVPDLGHGVLTYALLSGLGEKGPPQAATPDGLITVFSLLRYVSDQVPELAEKYHAGNKQYPVSINTGMDFPLALR
jgi:WD40 repeat protein